MPVHNRILFFVLGVSSLALLPLIFSHNVSLALETTCTDSDNGLDYYISGNVSGIGPQGRQYLKNDFCETGIYNNYVREYYCDGTTPRAVRYQCPNGCNNGACLLICTDNDHDGYALEGGACGLIDCDDTNPLINPGMTEVCDNGIDDNCNGLIDMADPQCQNDCSDSDNGLKYFRSGTVTDKNGNTYNDTCLVGSNNIQEYYCDPSGNSQSTIYNCPNGCQNGRCVDPNIIIVGWDGVQRDHFWECYNKSLPECPNGLPNIQELSGGQIFNETVGNGNTCTKPGWAQILSGYDVGTMGIYSNSDYHPLPEGYSIFEKIENRFGSENVKTIFAAGYDNNVGGACVGDPIYGGIELKGQPYCLTKNHLDYFETGLHKKDQIGNRALELLETNKNDLFFAFFHFHLVDGVGHMFGENSTDYSEMISYNDTQLGRIVDKLKELGIYDQTLIYVTTDHGFDENTDKHFNAPYGFLASNDYSIVRPADRRDMAPTILEKYGISLGQIGNAPPVNGYSLRSIPQMACVPEGGSYLDYNEAPVCCSGLNLVGLDKIDKYTHACVSPTGGQGDNSGYCTLCGNGVCSDPENACNCPTDCH